MKIAKLYLLVPPLFAVVCGSTGCQTAQRPTALLPLAQSSAPPLRAETPKPEPLAEIKPAQGGAIQPEPKPDPVADLIAQVEKEYQAGEDNYQAGNLEAARQSFDHAFNLLMGSSLDVHSDVRLQREFDKVMAGMNRRELQAAQQGETSVEQEAQPAPIDEVNEVTPPVDP